MTKRELRLIDGRKSFYGKAYVETDTKGNETLYSYGTPIIRKSRSGKLTRLYGGWSATTGRHIKAYCGLSKSEFLAMPHKATSSEKAAAYNGTLFR